jgi:hypothetical protein
VLIELWLLHSKHQRSRAWEVWWALVLGFFISALVQAWVPRERVEALMSGSSLRAVGWAAGLEAASSSCSYAAIAIAKSLFQKGASAASVRLKTTRVTGGARTPISPTEIHLIDLSLRSGATKHLVAPPTSDAPVFGGSA